MPAPKEWSDFLNGNVLLLTKNSKTPLYDKVTSRLQDAGFSNIITIQVPQYKTEDGSLIREWAKYFKNKPIRFDSADTAFTDLQNQSEKQESALGHIAAFQYIIDNNLDFAFIVEEDIVFHKDWKELAPNYFEVTPPDYYLCYVGHHCACGIDAHVLRAPAYRFHAVIVTKEGASYILDKVINDSKGLSTLDCMLHNYMTQALINQEEGTDNISNDFCNWYAWNAEMFPDNTVKKYFEHASKDQGLVFQEDQRVIN
jgi:hypothetical protein